MSEYCVYIHENKLNGKKYIGITKRKPCERWGNGSGYKTNIRFYRAIKKYGWDAFEHKIIATGLTKEAACEMEKALISENKSDQKEHGYNVSPGGWAVSEESAKKIGETRRARHIPSPTEGKHLSEETKRKISDARKGKKHPIEWNEEKRERYRAAKRGPKNPNYHKPMRDDLKQMLIEKNSKPVLQMHDGRIIKEYQSAKAAGMATGIFAGNISRVCNGKRETAGGYTWRFLDERGRVIV